MLTRVLSTRCVAVQVWAAMTAGVALWAGDWPQFLGPDRNAVSSETGLARTWPASGPKQLWSVPMGPGFSGPAVVGDQLYILDREGEAKDSVRCLDAKAGKELWTYAYEAPGKFSFPGSRSTPTVTATAVYTIGPMGHLHCLDRASHQPRWSKPLIQEFGGKLANWAVAQSPLLVKDMLIVAPQSPTAGVVAFKADSGELLWTSGPLGPLSYCSPTLARLGDVDQVVMISDKGTISGIALADGKLLWQYKGWNCGIPIASPVLIGDGRVFISGEYGAGSVMLRVSATAGQFTATELWKTQECMSQIHQTLLYQDHLYANSNGNKARDGFVCLDLDGKLKWKTGASPNFERGAVLLADGLIFAVNGQDGTLALIEPSPEQFKLVAGAKLLKGGQAWAPLVLVDGKLFARDQQSLKCFDVRATAAGT